MSEETPISLREYIDFNNRMRDQARDIAFQNMERRLDGLNELRKEVTSDRANFVTRVEYDGLEKEMTRRLVALENWQARLMGIGIVMMLIAGIVGAGAMKLFGK